jgi:tetratricopeptide (TPR) repeat protein
LSAIAHEDTPAIARATLLTLLEPQDEPSLTQAISSGLDDADPLVRIAALRSLRNFTPRQQMQYGSHLLRDPVRGVRVEAALTYADLRDLLAIEDARAFTAAADEYRAAQLSAANMPESLLQLGEFESRLGNADRGLRYVRAAVTQDPDLAIARYSYGLALVRTGDAENALQHLRRASELEPANARFRYVLGVALNSLGLGDEAIAVLTEAHSDFPDDYDIAWGLATMLRDVGDRETALTVALEIRRQFPDAANVDALIESLTIAN